MTPESRCLNCNAPLTGEYCSRCGQHATGRELRFVDVAGEALRDLVDWDSRFWRTLLPLLFRPGFLTAEFIAGRRARYVPPVRLYLIVSFGLFLVISLFGSGQSLVVVDERAPVTPGTSPPPAQEPDAGDHRLRSLDVRIDIADEQSPAWLQELERKLDANANRFHEDPQRFFEKMVEYLPQLMFLMLPVFALLLRLCYRAPFHYLQHLVFTLHFHSFAYLVYLAGFAAERTLSQQSDAPALLVVALYLPLALRRTYGSGWTGAVTKSAFLYLSYGILLAMGFTGALIAVFLAS